MAGSRPGAAAMIDHARILVTGGSGLLGGKLHELLPTAQFPSSAEFDVSNPQGMREWARAHPFEVLVHAAAFTSPPRIDADPLKAVDVNIVGTANVVRLCAEHGARLVYLCTDYVFRGDQGRYVEDDPVLPVNKYAWSKLGGECAVRLYDRSLVVRTTFGPDVFPYPKAFSDQWTSREGVSTLARKLVPLIEHEVLGVIHVGGPRRTVLDYARGLDLSKAIEPLSIHDVSFSVPVDTSLDCSRYDRVVAELERDS